MAIQINNVQELIEMANWSDKGSEDGYLQVELTADIDFSGIENFEGLGGSWHMNFDGNGHTIKGITGVSTTVWSLFNGTTEGEYYGSIKNLTVSNSALTADGKIAALCFNSRGCIFFSGKRYMLRFLCICKKQYQI